MGLARRRMGWLVVVAVLATVVTVAAGACSGGSGASSSDTSATYTTYARWDADLAALPVHADPSRPVEGIAVGDTFALALPVDPADPASSGGWYLRPRPSDAYVLAGRDEVLPQGSGIPGAAESQVFAFKALGPGSAEISFEGPTRARGSEPRPRVVFTVVIAPRGAGTTG